MPICNGWWVGGLVGVLVYLGGLVFWLETAGS
jgi:hypothetical protein